MQTLTVIYATPVAMSPIAACLSSLGEVRVLTLLDEALLSEVERHGGITEQCVERMSTLLTLAADADSDAVLVTCNAYSTVVANLRRRFAGLPIVIIDEPMITAVVEARPSSIGVIATVASGLESQLRLLTTALAVNGTSVPIRAVLREDAFDLLRCGDTVGHDRVIVERVAELLEEVDIVVLAQASIARVLESVDDDLAARVYSSPVAAVQQVAAVLAAAPQTSR
jgi:glutamate racemase